MRQLLPALFLSLTLSASAGAGVIQPVSPRKGAQVPAIHWRNENGVVHNLSEFAGYPLILLPIYTRCRATCPVNVAGLKQALAEASADPTQFRVLLFSFDPGDTPQMLARYRAMQKLPLEWSLGTGSPRDTEALLESIGFQYGQAGKEFTHPNLLTFLDSDLRLTSWIHGSHYSGREIDTALSVARGKGDWLGRHADVIYALLLLALSLGCVVLVHHVIELMQLRRHLRTNATES